MLKLCSEDHFGPPSYVWWTLLSFHPNCCQTRERLNVSARALFAGQSDMNWPVKCEQSDTLHFLVKAVRDCAIIQSPLPSPHAQEAHELLKAKQ